VVNRVHELRALQLGLGGVAMRQNVVNTPDEGVAAATRLDTWRNKSRNR
jgi:hypothetical protein